MVYHFKAQLAQGAQIRRLNVLRVIFQFEKTRAITAQQSLLAATALRISA